MAKENDSLIEKENDFHVEIGARIGISVEDGKPAMECVFVGSKRGEYFVITPPLQIESLKDALTNETPLGIKYLQEGRILEFQTKLIKIVYSPVELVLLEYPGKVRERNLRAHKRISCFISGTVEVEMGGNNGLVTGVIKDISKSGCCFHIEASDGVEMLFQVNEQINLRCKFPGIAGEREALGKVLAIRKKTDEIAIGIQFSDIMWWVPPYG